MITPATPPIVILFERHWDLAPKQVAKSLIPKLTEEGYNTLALEAGQDFTEEGLRTSCERSLKENLKLSADVNLYLSTPMARSWMKQLQVENTPLADIPFEKMIILIRECVSSREYLRVIEKIKNIPSQVMFKDVLNLAVQFKLELKGTEINAEEFQKIIDKDFRDRITLIKANEQRRITTISSNLLKFLNDKRGIIYTVGALHAENIISKLNSMGLGSRVLYYFPHSDKNYSSKYEDVKEFLSNQTLLGHTYCIKTDAEVNSLAEKILKDVRDNMPYISVLKDGTTSSILLSEYFGEKFQAFLRPGEFVDALLEITNPTRAEQITKKLGEVEISTSQRTMDGKSYLVIRNINTRPVADNLLKLK